MENKISIIVPLYNSSKTLHRCIDSILNQTYKNFELIFINDGSTDNSKIIIEEYMKKDDRIILFNIENKGVAHARNFGLTKISGNYVKFVDSDDDLYPECLEKLMNTLVENYADVSVCRFNHICFKQYLPKGVYDLTQDDQKFQYYSDFFACSMPWNKLYKKEVLTNKFNENLCLFEDEIFNLSNLNNIKKVAVLDEVLYNYFTDIQQDDSVSLVNTIVQSDFWNTKTGYWYKCNKLQNQREEILSDYKSEFYENLLYARMFDIAFWEFIKLISVGLPEEILTMEMLNIFKENDFINSVKCKEKFGIALKEISDSEFETLCKDFVKESCNIYKKSLTDNTIEPYYEILKIYGKYFTEQKFNITNRDLFANLIAY